MKKIKCKKDTEQAEKAEVEADNDLQEVHAQHMKGITVIKNLLFVRSTFRSFLWVFVSIFF